MNQFLSIILPVYNRQTRLDRQVRELLEILPDLTPEFEVLIVDDASTDSTEEVALELCREYPQVSLTRHMERRGFEACVHSGVVLAGGQVLFVHDSPLGPSIGQLTRLWQLRHRQQGVATTAPAPEANEQRDWLGRLLQWGRHLREHHVEVAAPAGLRMLSGPVIDGIRKQQIRLADLPMQSVHQATAAADDATAAPLPSHAQATGRGPNFLSRVKDFAVGE